MNRIIFIVLTIAVASCKIPSAVQLPVLKTIPDSFAVASDSQSIANISWKKFFTDSYLIAIIDSALKNNPDLSIALQRTEMARAELYMRRAAFLPSVDAVVTAGADRFGDYTLNGVGNFDTNLSPNIKEDQRIPTSLTPDYFAGFRANWEIDLWGKLKNRKRAAAARFLATEKGRQLAVTNIVATVATLYYEMLALDTELKIVRKNIVLQEEALEVVKVQKEGGRATELAVQQFTAQLLNTKAIEYNLLKQMKEVEFQINELAGRFGGDLARDTAFRINDLPFNPQTGLPSQLLLRRPDIIQAELELQAAKADVAAVRASFLPSLNLTPYLGINAFKAALLFDAGSVVYGAVAGLSAPIINRRLLKGEMNIGNARSLEALYQYQKALLGSYREVVTSLNDIQNTSKSFELKKEEVTELTNAVATARELYLAGYANYLEVITAQKGVLEAELQLTENKKQLLQGMVNLYRALGGGWN